ncbi:MAG: MucR family transcriptional regulator [Acetobacteraceae bacterium]|jgi:predicted transcriptional regulator
MIDHNYLLALAAQIVSAHVANNTVSSTDVPKLIHDVHRALADAERGPEPSAGEAAVPVAKSVFSDHLVCLECGKQFSMLKRHLGTDHQLTPDQYRQKWGLPASYPIVAPDYAKVRSKLAKRFGLGRLPVKAARKGGLGAAGRP